MSSSVRRRRSTPQSPQQVRVKSAHDRKLEAAQIARKLKTSASSDNAASHINYDGMYKRDHPLPHGHL